MCAVVAYVHGAGAVASYDSATAPKAILINATTMNETGPVYVPAGSNLTILGISAYQNDESWVGGLGKVTVSYEPLASDNIRKIQLGDVCSLILAFCLLISRTGTAYFSCLRFC